MRFIRGQTLSERIDRTLSPCARWPLRELGVNGGDEVAAVVVPDPLFPSNVAVYSASSHQSKET
jgi:hypothetical protein